MTAWTRPPLPAGAITSGPLFVGRQGTLSEIERIWASVQDNNRHVVLIGGESGVGKTRLVSEAAASLHEQGAAVLWGACHADYNIPFKPFVTAIETLLTNAAPGELTPVLGESATQLLRLIPKVQRHRPDLAGSGPAGQKTRAALFDAVLDLLVGVAERQPVVLVIEDLHWAASPTLQLVVHLVQSTAHSRLLVLITHRTTLPDRSAQLSHTIAELHRHDGVSRLDLSGLETGAITDYLVRAAGLPPAEARASAVALRLQTAGNAFFLHELWRDLSARDGVDTLRSPGFHAPQSVRDTLDRRLAAFDDEHVDVIELAAVAGEAFDLALLLEASEHPREVTLAAVDTGVGSGIFAAATEAPNRYRFQHTLARQAVLDRLGPSRQLNKHARVAQALERWSTDDPQVVARLAHHYEQACALGYTDRAVSYLVKAARHAQHSLAHEEAARLYDRAATLCAAGVDTADECSPSRTDLLLAAAQSYLNSGDFGEARRLYEQLTKVDEPAVRLRAAIGYEDASWRPGLYGGHALDLLSDALGDLPADADDPVAVRALASMGRALSFTGNEQRAEEIGERALAHARRSDDDDLIAHALSSTLWWGMTPSRAPLLLRRSQELAKLGGQLANDDHLGRASWHRAVLGYLQGDAEEWAAARNDLIRAARSGGQPFFRYMAGCCEYARQFVTGDLTGASRTVATLGELGAEFEADTTEGSYGTQMFMLKRVAGQLEEIRELVTGAEDPEAYWPPGLLALYCELGMVEPAARVLRHLLERLDTYCVDKSMWAGVLAFMADAAARLDDRDAAAALRPYLAEYQGFNLVAGQFVAVFGSADRLLARLDSVLGAPTAEEHLEVALDMDRRMGSLTHQVETLSAWSQHVTRHGGPQGAQRAARLHAEARALAEQVGHRGALRDLGEDAFLPPPPDLPDGITEREVEVLRLVAEGLPNREIAERLFISQNTVANHVRSILMKTGAANRTQAAIYATDHDLLTGGGP